MGLENIKLADVDWDFNAAGSWPKTVKIGVIVLSCFLVLAGGIYFDTLEQLQILDASEKKETELKTLFELKRHQASDVFEHENQLELIKQKLNEMIKQMPIDEEIAGLLIDISQTGIASGLEFKLFKPLPSVANDFYSELPINIEVIGQYEELCLFISGLAALPRIVTIHDFIITPIDKIKLSKQSNMMMVVTVKTYRENGNPQNDSK